MRSKAQESLRGLTPLAAVEAWLDGRFGIEDEAALLEAIRKDKRITISDEEISDLVCDAMEEGLSAQECLARLESSS